MWAVRIFLIVVGTLALAVVAFRVIFPLPSLEGRSTSDWLPPSDQTQLGAALKRDMAQHPGLSGVFPLSDGRDALGARLLLVRAAQATIDAQYYIWEDDNTGWVLLDELRAAAERGVRVRLLVDDNGTSGLDRELAALNAMPTAEVRLFNPFTFRNPKPVSYLFDFFRLNRRMHNKSITVDGIATVIGGRNIGDVYFSYGEGLHYLDLDVLAVGPAAAEVSANFDRYWASDSAYPADLVLPTAPEAVESIRLAADAARNSVEGSAYAEAVSASRLIEELANGLAPLEWTSVSLISDEPGKGLGLGTKQDLLVHRLFEKFAPPKTSFDLVSAYFVPGELGNQLLVSFAERGVATRVLTNSLEATDVLPVQGAYANYRPALVDAGVTLLELRAEATTKRDFKLSQVLVGSASSLHAKSFAIDVERIFIGSFNFDPRSAALNTEMGFLIESPDMAAALSGELDRDDAVYKVRRGDDGGLEWVGTQPEGGQQLYTTEPNTSVLKRGLARLFGWLPIEWML